MCTAVESYFLFNVEMTNYLQEADPQISFPTFLTC